MKKSLLFACLFSFILPGCGGGGGDTSGMTSEDVAEPPASQEDLDAQMEAAGYDPRKEGN